MSKRYGKRTGSRILSIVLSFVMMLTTVDVFSIPMVAKASETSDAATCEGEIMACANLVGRAWKSEDEFEFTISSLGESPLPEMTQVTVTKDSAGYTESFGKITFTEAGQYEYVISESHKGEYLGGITYDSSDRTVTIKVKEDEEGNLVADGTELVQTAVFTNTSIESIPYLDPTDEGNANKTQADYDFVTDGMTEMTTGWYVVNANVTVEKRITVSGNVNLILCDGAELTASAGVNVPEGNSLTVWAQSLSENTAGKLTATTPGQYQAGIGGNSGESCGTVTINGGVINANGGERSAGIGGGLYGDGGTVTINGGKVTANGGNENAPVTGGAGIGGGGSNKGNMMAGSGGTVIITGGTVYANGFSWAAGIGGGGGNGNAATTSNGGKGGNVLISGGTVYANGGHRAAGIGGANGAPGGTVEITGGLVVATTISKDDAQAIGHGEHNGDAGTVTLGGEMIVIAGDGENNTQLYDNSNGALACQDNHWAKITSETDVTLSVSYVDAAGVPKGPVSAYRIGTSNNLGSGWYVVSGNVTMDSRLNVKGDVNLILCDGAELTVNAGIGVNSGYSLTIYGQSGQTGALKAFGNDCYSAIGSDDQKDSGTIIINGGSVTAKGGYKSAGIGGGRAGSGGVIIVNGGNVTAAGGQYGAGIGGGYQGDGGMVTITGGIVTAAGGNEDDPTSGGAGIGGGGTDTGNKNAGNGGTVTITGGTVYANGFSWAAGIGGGGGSGSSEDTSNGGKGGNVLISGGTVYANGGHRAAGIGCANGAPGGTVEITGGLVVATTLSKDDAQAIGHGEHNEGAGSLTLGDEMNVIAGDGENNTQLFEKSDGVSACHDNYWAKITDVKEATLSVSYVDAAGVPQGPVEAYRIGSYNNLGSGWYAVSGNVTMDSRLNVKGDVNLILCDGAQLTANKGVGVNKGYSLTIYGQSGQTGALRAAGIECYSAIGSDDQKDSGTIIINGGNVTANGGYKGAGIGGGRAGSGGVIAINGGTVNATGGQWGPGIGGGGWMNNDIVAGYGGDVTITGGTVTATGGRQSAGIGGGLQGDGGKVTISGGTVTANGGDEGEPATGGAGIGGGGCDVDSLKGGDGGTVIITGGTVYANGFSWAAGIGGGGGTGNSGNTSNGGKGGNVQISGGTVYANGGHRAAGIGGANGSQGGTVEITGGLVVATTISQKDAQAIGHGEHNGDAGTVTLGGEMIVIAGDGKNNTQLYDNSNGASAIQDNYWAKITSETDVTLNVSYVDAAGVPKGPVSAYRIDSYNNLDSGWYVVSENVTMDSRLNVKGDVNLILCDGAELTAIAGVNVPEGTSLTIWAQSLSENTAGKLTVTTSGKYQAGIGGNDDEGCGTVIINGGVINANGGERGAGIGGGRYGDGGTVTINGGKVTANGGNKDNPTTGGAGIGGGGTDTVNRNAGDGGTVTITGGTVYANGFSWAAGIGGGGGSGYSNTTTNGGKGGTVRISGGTVYANGGHRAAGIGGANGAPGGKVTITGGLVVATTDSADDAQAIGHGERNDDAGEVSFSGMKVYIIDSSDATPVPYSMRVKGCYEKWVKITVCDDHDYKIYRNNGENHTLYCKNCGKLGATESHAFVNHVCACNAKEAFSYVVTFKVKNGSWNEGEGEEATADKTVTLNGIGADKLKLSADQIPAVGKRPGSIYLEGAWNVTPSTETEITEDTTYTYVYTQKETAVVTKAPVGNNLTYAGYEQELVTAGEASGGTTYYALGVNATTKPAASAYATTIPKKTEAKTYYVWYKAVGDAEHLDSEEKCIEVSVKKATGSLKIESASKDWTYDGEGHTYQVYTVTYNGEVIEGVEGQTVFTLSTGDNLTISPTAVAVRDSWDAEKNSFVYVIENSDCYNFENPLKEEGNLTISKRKMIITARSEEFTYNGKAQSLNEYDVTGLAGSDEITAIVTGSITYPEEGTVVNQLASYEFKTGDPGNYEVTTADGALTMKNASAAITITAVDEEWTYDGTAHGNDAVSVTGGSLFEGDVLVAKASGSVTSVADSAAGNNPVAAGYKIMHGDTDVTGNYVITAVAGTLTVKQREVKVTARNKEFTYNGKAQSLNEYDVTGLVGTDEITAVVTGSITYPEEGTVVNQLASYEFKTGNPGNYSVTTADGALTMKNASAAITITAADGEWVYDGMAHGNDAVSVTGGMLFAGDTLVATASGSVTGVADSAAGNNPVAAGYKIMHGDADVTGNYVITTVAGTLTVKKREVTVSVRDETKEYNGSEQTGSTGVVFENIVLGQTAIIGYVPPKGMLVNAYDNGSFDKNSFNVVDGEGKDVTANYVLGALTAGKLTITDRSEKYQIMVTANSNTANVYDGNEKSAAGFETLRFTVDGNVYVVEGLTTSDPRSINVCNLENAISGTAIVRDVQGNDVTAQFIVKTTNGKLEITARTVTVVADGKIKDTEKKDPKLTYTVSGLLGSDSLTGELTRQTGELPGTYAILQGTLKAGDNYRIHYVGAYLTILQGDYLDPLRELLKYAISLGGERTVTWDKGTGLTYDIMKTLQDHPQLTLIFQYNFANVSYEVTIRGKDVVTDPDVPWYGPMNLYGRYGLRISSFNPSTGERTYRVVRGDNLTKIARRFNVTVDWLVKKNLIKNPNLIWANQMLKY